MMTDDRILNEEDKIHMPVQTIIFRHCFPQIKRESEKISPKSAIVRTIRTYDFR